MNTGHMTLDWLAEYWAEIVVGSLIGLMMLALAWLVLQSAAQRHALVHEGCVVVDSHTITYLQIYYFDGKTPSFVPQDITQEKWACPDGRSFWL